MSGRTLVHFLLCDVDNITNILPTDKLQVSKKTIISGQSTNKHGTYIKSRLANSLSLCVFYWISDYKISTLYILHFHVQAQFLFIFEIKLST